MRSGDITESVPLHLSLSISLYLSLSGATIELFVCLLIEASRHSALQGGGPLLMYK